MLARAFFGTRPRGFPYPHAVPERILIIRPSALGDVCRSVPVLVSLRRAYPRARIDWLVHEGFTHAVEAHPDLSRVVAFPRKALGAAMASLRVGPAVDFIKQLRREGYDLVLDAQGLARSGFLAWATRAPRRVGYADAREMGWLGLTERHHVPRALHSVDRMLGLVRAMGVEPIADMRLYTPPEARIAADADAALAGKRYAVLAPTSRWPGKQWPAERFAALAPRLLEMRLDAVVVVGSASERGQIGPLLDAALAARLGGRLVDRVGATTVGGLMALVERAALVVANDSAALHMAVGFETPAVALFGPTRADRVGPYRRESSVVQHLRPGERLDHKDLALGRRLMERITVDEVAERSAWALARALR